MKGAHLRYRLIIQLTAQFLCMSVCPNEPVDPRTRKTTCRLESFSLTDANFRLQDRVDTFQAQV